MFLGKPRPVIDVAAERAAAIRDLADSARRECAGKEAIIAFVNAWLAKGIAGLYPANGRPLKADEIEELEREGYFKPPRIERIPPPIGGASSAPIPYRGSRRRRA
jgi:hypothetical protein